MRSANPPPPPTFIPLGGEPEILLLEDAPRVDERQERHRAEITERKEIVPYFEIPEERALCR